VQAQRRALVLHEAKIHEPHVRLSSARKGRESSDFFPRDPFVT
jgi:hypothetical protein